MWTNNARDITAEALARLGLTRIADLTLRKITEYHTNYTNYLEQRDANMERLRAIIPDIDRLRSHIAAAHVSDDQIRTTIREDWQRYDGGAVAFLAAILSGREPTDFLVIEGDDFERFAYEPESGP